MQQSVLQSLVQKIGSADWQNWQIVRYTFYDSVRLVVAGTNNITLFTNPIGSTDPISTLQKTLEDTNLTKAGSFGQQYYIISQIRTKVLTLAKARQPAGISDNTGTIWGNLTGMASALYDLLQDGVFLMSIGQKQYYTVAQPFKAMPPGIGPEVTQWASNALLSESKMVFQDNDEKNVYAITPAQMVEPDQTFQVSIQFPNANTPAFTNLVNSASPAINIMVMFDGYAVRPAQ